jgi:DNA-binding NarL/FixJ family response regulator
MRVLVVDYHTLFQEGLVRLLSTEQDISVVGEAADGWEAVIEARRLKPDLVLLDPRMPTGNGGIPEANQIGSSCHQVPSAHRI